MSKSVVVALLIMALLIGWYAFTTPPQQRDILHALRTADTITVSEYLRGPLEGGYEGPLTQKTLSEEERKELQKAFTLHGLADKPTCDFDPHHKIECHMPDSSVIVINLCFLCNQYALANGKSTGMGPWNTSLRETLRKLGIPIRPEMYAKKS